MEEASAVVAVLAAFAVFILCALFATGKWRPGAERQAEPRPGVSPSNTTSITQKVTQIALVSVKKMVGAAPDQPALGPGKSGGSGDGPQGGAPSGRDDDLDELTAWDDDDPPPLRVDTEVIRQDDPAQRRPDAPTAFERLRGQVSGWLPTTKEPPAISGPAKDESSSSDRARGSAGAATAGVLPDPQDHLSAVATKNTPADEFEVLIEQLNRTADTEPAHDQMSIAKPQQTTLEGRQVYVEPAPVELEGVDMSQAPAVPTPGGPPMQMPTVQQLQASLATGGFNRLIAWLRAFRRASANTLQQATMMHSDALAIARRARTKYALALQAFQAVQTDRLDRQTINRVFAMLEQAQREAIAAAQATHATAALVVAAGGAPPTVAAAINTLQRNHGGIAAAIQASPVNPVANVNWYKR